MRNFFSTSGLRRGLSWLPAVLLAAPAFAQVDTYSFTPSVSTFAPLPATATDVPAVLADDAVSGALPIGFSFVFDGAVSTQTWAGSNGWVSFNPASAAVTFGPLYNNLLDDITNGDLKPLAAAYWDDLDGRDPGARASYLTTGTAPNRVFTMEWLNWKRFGGTGVGLSFQIKLYETSNRVEFVYRPASAPLSNASASIGLAGAVAAGSTTFLSLDSPGTSPVASSTVETTTISAVPAAGQVYAFAPAAPAACPTPRGLRATPTSATAATLTWTVASGTGPFTVQYGPAGFNPALPSSGSNSYTTLTGVTGTSTSVTGLSGGGAYQFYVTQVCGGAAGSSVRSNAGSFILNNEPCGAGILPVNNTCTQVSGTTQGASTTVPNGYANPGSCGFNSTPLDVWFSFTTAATGPTSSAVRISVTGSGAQVVRAFSAAACTGPFTDVGCQTATTGSAVPDLDLTSLQPSTTYYVSVSNSSSFQPALGPFTICASPVPNCPIPVGLSAGTLTNTTAQISWGGGTAGSTYTLIYGAPGFSPATGGTTITGVTTSTATLTGLQPNTSYEVYVQQVCGGFNGSSTLAGPLSFATPLTVPLNDNPCGAITLSNGTTTGSNVGSTTSLQPGISLPACSPSAAPKDVWFAFTAAQSTSTLTLTGTAAGMVRAYTAPDCANGPFALLANGCASSGANNVGVPSLALAGLTAGTRYYVAVSGYGSSNATGSFTISATNVLATRALANTDALLVYPNPTSTGQLTLRLAPAAGPRQATLLNALGQMVRREALTGTATEYTLSTRQLPAGVYTLRVSQNGETLTRKVVLE